MLIYYYSHKLYFLRIEINHISKKEIYASVTQYIAWKLKRNNKLIYGTYLLIPFIHSKLII